MNSNGFDNRSYWRSRVSGNIDLGVVGHRSLGRGYNEYIYRRRIEALDEYLVNLGKPISELKVLDIGCGSGFYIDFWQKHGVQHLTGVDISPDSVSFMKQMYPDYTFAVVDATTPTGFAEFDDAYDIVTIFDVIYHVIDDSQAAQLLINALNLLADNGRLLLTDTLGNNNYSFVSHVRFRSIKFYDEICKSENFYINNRLLLFVLLQPPILRSIYFDYIVSGLYYLAGKIYRINDSIGRLFGSLFYRFDRYLLKSSIHIPNQEMLIISRENK